MQVAAVSASVSLQASHHVVAWLSLKVRACWLVIPIPTVATAVPLWEQVLVPVWQTRFRRVVGLLERLTD